MAGAQARGYYSSPEKDSLRDGFDLSLIQSVSDARGRPLRYFGLPGAECRDIMAWKHLLGHVTAVELNEGNVHALRLHLDTHLPDLQYRVHHGEMDRVILQNKATKGPYNQRQFVPMTHDPQLGYIWDFDVVYLDYFGKFLPFGKGKPSVRNRAEALRRLFHIDRQDAHGQWLLMVTVEALLDAEDRAHMKTFLDEGRAGATANPALGEALNFLLAPGLSESEEAARLIHGTAGLIIAYAATGANVVVEPCGSVLYKGAKDRPMVHLAYLVTPTPGWNHQVDPAVLLRVPLLQVSTTQASGLELRPEQLPDQTPASMRSRLAFLGHHATTICPD